MGASVDKLKKCYICKKEMTLENYYLSKNGNYNFCCIPCDRKRKAVYRAENKEKIALAENKYINTERGYVNEVIGGIFQRAKRESTRKKWVPDMTKQEIYAELMLYVQDYGRTCEYCKHPWTYVRRLGTRGEGQKSRRSGIETNFSIDRLDTTKTYSSIDDYYLDAGFNPMEVRMNLEDRARQIRQENQPTYGSPKTYYSVDKEGKLTTANGILVKIPGQVPFIMNSDTGMRLDSSFTDKEPKGPDNTKKVYNEKTGKLQFATEKQISENKDLVPLQEDTSITNLDKKFNIYKAAFTEDNNKLPPNKRLTPVQIDAKAMKAASTTRTEEVSLDKVDENILGVEIPVIGDTLWKISNRDNILGFEAKARRISEGVAGAVGKEGFASEQELESFNRLKLFKNEIIRTLALNKRYPVKEMERILSDVDIQPGVFKSKKELQSSLKSLETKLNEEKSKLIEINKSPGIANDEKRENLRSIADLSYFIKQIGIPKEDGTKRLKYNPQTKKMEEI